MADDEKTFTFDELSPEAQERACDEHRYWNVEHGDWLDIDYYVDYFKEMMAERGIDMDLTDRLTIYDDYERWYCSVKLDNWVISDNIYDWVQKTPTPKAYGSINNTSTMTSNFSELLKKQLSINNKSLDEQIERERQTIFSYLKSLVTDGNEGNTYLMFSIRSTDYRGSYNPQFHSISSDWHILSFYISRVIDGVVYAYDNDESDPNEFFTPYAQFYVDGEEMDSRVVQDDNEYREAWSELEKVYDMVHDVVPFMFREWFNEKLDVLTKTAESHYEYLISDKGVGESLESNEVEFDKDGNTV
jgi:hypothetical protein